jgi:gluconate 2-dehydrogenase gamma chain
VAIFEYHEVTMQRRDFFKIGATFVIPAAWAQQAAKPDWRPSVLDDHQNETVIVLTDLIIPTTDTPGAKAVRVNRYVDLFLRDGTTLQRESFLSGLSWLDGYSIREHGHPFVHCPAADQTAMLRVLDRGEGPGHKFFAQVKALTTLIYYNTEIGYRELNKGGRVPATFGCEHPSHA